ncbi:MAG: Rieske (2Fe-2S) domain protein [Deltaproteobacteria bacterium]|nr:Rieske (2Fe-2S) domain protein [Deltaproteobacteria bacterium]
MGGAAAVCAGGCSGPEQATLDAGHIITILPDPVDGILVLPFSDFEVLRTTKGWVRGTPPAWGKPVIVINTGPSYVALAAGCTHLGCGVNYADSLDLLLCPCHGAEYSLAGDVIRGPATMPLVVYSVTADKVSVRVTLG